MGKAAIKATQAADYVNAGTIEFLVDSKGNFYFIEMNTRIQVEHAVTEEVTGIDFIKEQINIASGNRLSISQKKCPLTSMPSNAVFVPKTLGMDSLHHRNNRFVLRTRWSWVRVDSHAYGGYTVSPFYDSMIANVTYGSTRKIGLDRMYRA